MFLLPYSGILVAFHVYRNHDHRTAGRPAECDREPGDTEKMLMQRFDSMGIPSVLALNKIDRLKEKSDVITTIAAYSNEYSFDDIVPVSAQTGSGINELIDALSKQAEEGEHMFDADTLTDQPERVLAGEIIREKILRLTDKEIPHGTAVVIERLKQRSEGGITDIDATIYCERANHKGIIIGKGGSMLKKIGTYARQDMENLFDCKINLTLWVKVKEDWRNREGILRSLGYDESNFD